MQLTQAVSPVTGLGSRFLQITKPIRKGMLPVVGRLIFQPAKGESRCKAGALAAVRVSECGIMRPHTIDGVGL